MGRPAAVHCRKLICSPVVISSFWMMVALVAELMGMEMPPLIEASGMMIMRHFLKLGGRSKSFVSAAATPATMAQDARSDMNPESTHVVIPKAKTSFFESFPNR